MFIWLPVTILAVSIAVIVWIVSRKFVYLKKLTPEAAGSRSEDYKEMNREMFKELISFVETVNLRKHFINMLNDIEKFLRKFRLLFIRADSSMNKLIHRIRNSSKNQEEIMIQKEERRVEAAPEVDNLEKSDDPRVKEQELIIQIAQNPRDSHLYLQLGRLYLSLESREDALESFKKVIELDPDNSYARDKVSELSEAESVN